LVLPSLEPPAQTFRAQESCWHAGEGFPFCQVTSCGSSGAANGRAGEEYQVRARYQVRANPLLVDPKQPTQTRTPSREQQERTARDSQLKTHLKPNKRATPTPNHSLVPECLTHPRPSPTQARPSVREVASVMIKAGAPASTTKGNRRASRESGVLGSHSHGKGTRGEGRYRSN